MRPRTPIMAGDMTAVASDWGWGASSGGSPLRRRYWRPKAHGKPRCVQHALYVTADGSAVTYSCGTELRLVLAEIDDDMV